MRVALLTGALSGLLLFFLRGLLAWSHIPLLDYFVLPGAICSLVFLSGQLWQVRRGIAEALSPGRAWILYAVTCLLIALCLHYVSRALLDSRDPELIEAAARAGSSVFAIDRTTFTHQGMRQALGGVLATGWLLVRSAVRARARRTSTQQDALKTG